MADIPYASGCIAHRIPFPITKPPIPIPITFMTDFVLEKNVVVGIFVRIVILIDKMITIKCTNNGYCPYLINQFFL